MQKFNACSCSDAGSYTKSEPGWDACQSDFVECGYGAGCPCGIAYYFDSCGASATTTRVGNDCWSASTSTSGADYGSGRCCCYGNGD